MTLRVLVTGGRDYGEVPRDTLLADRFSRRVRADREQKLLDSELDKLRIEHVSLVIIQGGATGADRLARDWAVRQMCMGRPVELINEPADWNKHGRAAGPIRNSRMLEWKPDLILGFPGGTGTADMVDKAKRAGIPVKRIEGL